MAKESNEKIHKSQIACNANSYTKISIIFPPVQQGKNMCLIVEKGVNNGCETNNYILLSLSKTIDIHTKFCIWSRL